MPRWWRADGPIGSRITAEIAKVGENMGVPRTAKLTADYIGSYSHMGGKIGVLVQLDGAQGEATQHEAFKAFVNELAMHVAAAAPQFTTRAEVPAEAVEKEKEIYRAQMAESGKPANVIEKIIEGKLGAFYEQVCLVDQPTIRDPKVKVSQALDAVSKAVGSAGRDQGLRTLQGRRGEPGVEQAQDDGQQVSRPARRAACRLQPAGYAVVDRRRPRACPCRRSLRSARV